MVKPHSKYFYHNLVTNVDQKLDVAVACVSWTNMTVVTLIICVIVIELKKKKDLYATNFVDKEQYEPAEQFIREYDTHEVNLYSCHGYL